MAKGAVLNVAFIEALGLNDHLLVLTKPILNKPHPTLLEPMFHIHTEQFGEPIYLERDYLYESQLPIKPSYAAGEKVLIWTHRVLRRRNNDPENEAQLVLLASDLFLLDEPHEFLRFKHFLKSQRILDAQARDWLAKHHEAFPTLSASTEGMRAILGCLGHIQEWPDPDNGFRKRSGVEHSFEGVAKQYSPALVIARNSSLLVDGLLRMPPDERLRVFRLMSYAEDAERGPTGLLTFLRDLGMASGNALLKRQTAAIGSGLDLSKALEAVRQYLVSAEEPTLPQ
jgi:hypothetical protein